MNTLCAAAYNTLIDNINEKLPPLSKLLVRTDLSMSVLGILTTFFDESCCPCSRFALTLNVLALPFRVCPVTIRTDLELL